MTNMSWNRLTFASWSSSSRLNEMYKAATASPIGSLPAVFPSSFALSRMAMALRLTGSGREAVTATLLTHLIGSGMAGMMSRRSRRRR